MRNVEEENQISCVVEYGTIYSKRDMVRVLRDLDKVQYSDVFNNVVVSEGEGFVIEVYSNSFDATIIFNSCLHINVNGFEYLKVRTSPTKEIDLIAGHRTIRLKPLSPVNFDSRLEEELDEQRIATFTQLACANNEEEVNYFLD